MTDRDRILYTDLIGRLIAIGLLVVLYSFLNSKRITSIDVVPIFIICALIWLVPKSIFLINKSYMNNQKFPIQPVEDKLIVKKETVPVGERKFEVRDEDLKKTPVACQVMACGPGTETRSMPVKDGDRVLISRMAGFEVEHEGEKYLLITLNDIIGVLEPVKDVQVVER